MVMLLVSKYVDVCVDKSLTVGRAVQDGGGGGDARRLAWVEEVSAGAGAGVGGAVDVGEDE